MHGEVCRATAFRRIDTQQPFPAASVPQAAPIAVTRTRASLPTVLPRVLDRHRSGRNDAGVVPGTGREERIDALLRVLFAVQATASIPFAAPSAVSRDVATGPPAILTTVLERSWRPILEGLDQLLHGAVCLLSIDRLIVVNWGQEYLLSQVRRRAAFQLHFRHGLVSRRNYRCPASAPGARNDQGQSRRQQQCQHSGDTGESPALGGGHLRRLLVPHQLA
mmetsp:Transcript_48564/g.106091  ORF Transcript_48564/g.106091 Transcript_48564/m.106091 type:complete len:221 (-) Transcript_48564:115-777(-)